MKININNERFNDDSFVLDKERQIEGTLASLVKPWLKYYDIDINTYSDEKMAYLDTDMNSYDYFLKVTKSYGNIPMISYCGKIYYREDVINKIEEYIKRFNKMNIRRGDIVSFMMLNNPDIIFMWFALSKLGATANLIKFDEAEDRIRDILVKTKSKYFFVNDVPLITKKDLSDIAGITLYDVVIKYKNFKIKDNVLISHVGLTGPGILNISSEISRNVDYNILDNADVKLDEVLSVDLCPDFNQEELKTKFTNDFQDKGKTYIKNYLKYFLTNNFIPFFLESVEIEGETQLSRINKKQKNKLVEALKNFKFEISAFNKDLSHVTLGGIAIENINPKTMESTITEDLYFAGEVLEPVGPTGGYNLKIAFSTGYLAGLSASKK